MKVVIGAAYGDEGKGRIVNELSDERTTVIRFNGGAQAGHTVVQNGKRHVFSHFGAGTLKGAHTHLSRFFVLHPILHQKELNELPMTWNPCVTVDPRCEITFPLDVYFNNHNADNLKHGTVGVGFGETLERASRGYDITPCNLDTAEDKMIAWANIRSAELEIEDKTTMNRIIRDIPVYLDTINHFLKYVGCMYDEELMTTERKLIFEGAQGLMLDQDYGVFPHVTRSNTGMKNVIAIAGDREFDITYVTRAYGTRHGNGPFPYENAQPPFPGYQDKTNQDGGAQGKLRFAPLNLDDIRAAIKHDAGDRPYRCAITCMDEVPATVKYIHNERLNETFQLPHVVGTVLECPVATRYSP